MKETMRKILLTVTLIACFGIQGCQSKVERTEVIPAQLELEWTESLDKESNPYKEKSISPELEKQLLKFGAYRSSSTQTYTNEKAWVTHHVTFLREVKDEEHFETMEFLMKAFKEQPFKATFHGKIRKRIIEDKFSFFSSAKEETIYPHTTIEIPEQTPVRK